MIELHCLQRTRLRPSHILLWMALLMVGLILALFPLSWILIAVPGAIVIGLTLLKPQYALYLLCFAIPFGSLFEISLGGITADVTEGVIGLMLAGWLARSLALKEERWIWPRQTLPLALFIGAALLSLVNATSLPLAFKETAKWVEYLGVMLFVANAITLRQSQTAAASLLLAGVAQAMLGIFQFFAQSGPEFFVWGRFMRAYGTFEQPNPYGGYLGLIAPLALALTFLLFERRKQKKRIPAWLIWLAPGSLVVIAIGLGMSGSRGAWLAFGAAFAAVNLARSRKGAMTFTTLLIVIALIAGLGSFRLLPESIIQRLVSFVPFIGVRDVRSVEVTDANYASVERLAFWQAALDMWRDHPWLGVGFGNYQTTYSQYALPKWRMSLGHAHNYYLNVAAETGLLGLTAYLTLWGTTLWQTSQAIRTSDDRYAKALALGALGVLVHASVHNVVDNLWVQNMYIQVAIVLGLVCNRSIATDLSQKGQSG